MEIEGVRRAEQQAVEADLVLLVTEAGHAKTNVWSGSESLIRVANKVDLTELEPGLVENTDGIMEVRISAKNGAGIEVLRAYILEKVGFVSEGSTYTARKRHLIALDEAMPALRRA